MLVVKMVVADRRYESADDITAALTAPMLKAKMYGGAKLLMVIGNTMALSPRSYGDKGPYEVEFQSGREETNKRLNCCQIELRLQDGCSQGTTEDYHRRKKIHHHPNSHD